LLAIANAAASDRHMTAVHDAVSSIEFVDPVTRDSHAERPSWPDNDQPSTSLSETAVESELVERA
jgi:hypothetical protein